jgi:competence protein ComEC
MTTLMLVAVIFDRPSLSMRNLALAVFLVVAFEPEAILGASFQLSFAAVAALIAVYEWRGDYLSRIRAQDADPRPRGRLFEWREAIVDHLLHGPGAALVATLCATSATAAFMANDFHELSPYVLIGNPLTLAAIEFFAVPCALFGAFLFPFGLDGFVWRYLETGINLVTSLASLIASAPGATIHVKAFAPWGVVFLALAVLSAVLWRTWALRLTAIPFALIGLTGASGGPGFDIVAPRTGDAAALRAPSGELTLLGKKPGAFAAEQWLRADADPRKPGAAGGGACDEYGCVGRAVDGRLVALVLERDAFLEDCARAAIIVTPLRAPRGCAAPAVIDKSRLEETGAVSLRLLKDGALEWTTARAMEEDRPWSPKPSRRKIDVALDDSEEASLADSPE